MFVFLCELFEQFVPSTKLYSVCTLYTGENSVEVKREGDISNIDVSPNEMTGTSVFLFFSAADLSIVYH